MRILSGRQIHLLQKLAQAVCDDETCDQGEAARAIAGLGIDKFPGETFCEAVVATIREQQLLQDGCVQAALEQHAMRRQRGCV